MGIKKLRVSFKSSFWENKIQKDVGLLKVLTEKSVGDFSNLFEIPKTKFKSRCFVWTANICIQLSFDKLTETLRDSDPNFFLRISGRDRKPETFLRMILLLVFFSPPSPGRMPRDQFGAKPRRHDYAAPLETLPNTQLNDSSWWSTDQTQNIDIDKLSYPRSHGQVARAVNCRARGPGFNPCSFQVFPLCTRR